MLKINFQEILSSLNQPTVGKKDILVARILSTSTSISIALDDSKVDQGDTLTASTNTAEQESNINSSRSSPTIEIHSRKTEEDLHQSKRMKIELEQESIVEESTVLDNSDVSPRGTERDTGEDNQDHQEFLEQYQLELENVHATDMYLDTVYSIHS